MSGKQGGNQHFWVRVFLLGVNKRQRLEENSARPCVASLQTCRLYSRLYKNGEWSAVVRGRGHQVEGRRHDGWTPELLASAGWGGQRGGATKEEIKRSRSF